MFVLEIWLSHFCDAAWPPRVQSRLTSRHSSICPSTFATIWLACMPPLISATLVRLSDQHSAAKFNGSFDAESSTTPPMMTRLIIRLMCQHLLLLWSFWILHRIPTISWICVVTAQTPRRREVRPRSADHSRFEGEAEESSVSGSNSAADTDGDESNAAAEYRAAVMSVRNRRTAVHHIRAGTTRCAVCRKFAKFLALFQ